MNIFLLVTLISYGIWSFINPLESGTWWMEAAPVLALLPVLIVTHKKFPLTPLLYGLIWLHAILLLTGAHYTYAKAPPGEWLGQLCGLDRNNFDRIGHLMQGFVPALAAREILLRTSPLKWGKWMFALIVFSCGGISALYEIIEWLAAVIGGEAAESFLGTQGDVWDTQKDMALAFAGAIAGLLLLARFQDKQLASFSN